VGHLFLASSFLLCIVYCEIRRLVGELGMYGTEREEIYLPVLYVHVLTYYCRGERDAVPSLSKKKDKTKEASGKQRHSLAFFQAACVSRVLTRSCQGMRSRGSCLPFTLLKSQGHKHYDKEMNEKDPHTQSERGEKRA
jgi:hypothetical protein